MTDAPGDANLDSRLGATLRDLGNLRRDTGRLEEAEPYYRRALAIHEELAPRHPTRPQILLQLGWDSWELGRFLMRAHRYEEIEPFSIRAASLFEGLGNDYPEVVSYRNFLAQALSDVAIARIQTGRRAEAEQLIRHHEARLGRQGVVDLLNLVAWHMVQRDTPRHFDREYPIELARRALAIQPESIYAWHVKGMGCYRAGRWEEATKALARANELERDDGLAFNGFFLAMAYHKEGEREKARYWYDRSVAWMAVHKTTDPNALRYRAEAEAELGLGADIMPNGGEAFAP